MPNGFTLAAVQTTVDDIDPDTLMVAAGVALSLIAVLELYPAWKRARSG